VKAVLDHLGLKKHHKPIFFIHHHQLSLASYFQHQQFQLSQPRNSNYFLHSPPPAVIGKLFSTPAVSTFSTTKQQLFSFEHQKYCFSIFCNGRIQGTLIFKF